MTLRKYPHVLDADRKSATELFEGAAPALVAALPSRHLPDRLRGRLGPALASQVDALPDDGYIDRRETIRRFIGLECWAGRLPPATTRIRTQVALIAIESRDCGHPGGPFLLNETQLAKDCGYSRQTVWGALRPLKSPSYKGKPKLVRSQSPMKCWGSWPSLGPASGTGNRRPGFWALRPDLWVVEEAHGYGVSAVSVNSHRYTPEGKDLRGADQRASKVTQDLSPAVRAGRAADRTRWLFTDSVNPNALPTGRDIQRLATSLRELLPGSLAGPLLSVLIQRSKRTATLGVWREVCRAAVDRLCVVSVGRPADPHSGEVGKDEVTWRARLALRALVAGDPAWIEVLNAGGTKQALTSRELAKIERRIAGADRKLAVMGEVEDDGLYCQCCGKPVRLGPPPDYARWYRQLPDCFDLLRIPPETPFLYDDYDLRWKLSGPILSRASTARSPRKKPREEPAKIEEHRGPHWCHTRLYLRTHFYLANERTRLQRELAGPVSTPVEVETPLPPDGLAVLSFIRGYRTRHVPVKMIETCVALSEGVTLYGRDGVLWRYWRQGSDSVTHDGVLSELRKRGLIEDFNGGRMAYITAAGREALPPDPKREAKRERVARAREQAHRQAIEAAFT